jgi:biopolymer transport protein ExbB/TolQ
MATSYPQATALMSPQENVDPVASGKTDRATDTHLAWLAKATAAGEDGQKYLLVMRFLLLNLIGFGVLAAAYIHGLVDLVVASDRTHLSAAIFVVFLSGLAICAQKVWQTSNDLNQTRSFDPLTSSRAQAYLAQLRGNAPDSRTLLAGTLRFKLSHRIGVVRNIANSLVILGLIGTVIGFIIALSGVDPENASDINAVTPMVSTLVEGMSTALYTTLVGAVLNVWLMANYHLLATGTVKLITALVEFGEAHGRA